MSKLIWLVIQDRVPAFSPSKAKSFIEKELGAPLYMLYKEFEDLPIAAASLGQVFALHFPLFSRFMPTLAVWWQRIGLKGISVHIVPIITTRKFQKITHFHMQCSLSFGNLDRCTELSCITERRWW